MDLKISQRCALVTGGSKGLGRAIAGALAAENARVAICARDATNLALAATELRVSGYVCDIANRHSLDDLLLAVKKDFGNIDILVINAGGPPTADFMCVDDDSWYTAFDALWLSAVRLIRGCLPDMRERRWGRIILVTSISARESLDRLTISNALRPGLHGLIKSLSREVARDGITVNAVMPGFTLTDRLKAVGFGQKEVAQIPMGRAGQPAELGALAAFLSSEQAGYVTGQAIACDGGFLRSI